MSAIARNKRRLLGFALLIVAATGLYAATERPKASSPTADDHSRFADVARELIVPTVMDRHSRLMQSSDGLTFLAELNQTLTSEFKTKVERRILSMQDLSKSDDFSHEVLDQLRSGKRNVLQLSADGKRVGYYAALNASRQCLGCHYHKDYVHQEGDLLGVVIIATPLE